MHLGGLFQPQINIDFCSLVNAFADSIFCVINSKETSVCVFMTIDVHATYYGTEE